MILHHCKQGSDEWHELRARMFTGSKLGPWALEPVKVTLTVDEIKAELDRWEVPRKGLVKRDDLLAVLPNPWRFNVLCEGAVTAIIASIHAERVLRLKAKSPSTMTMEEQIMLERESELEAKENRAFEYNIPVKYGKMLEPFARSFYESRNNCEVVEVGFIEHESGGFGVSPDGLIYHADGTASHGLEIKSLLPGNHLAYLREGGLPKEFEYQCHAGMSASGLNRWDLLLFCPGDAPLLVEVRRDAFTDQLESGLKTLVAEKAKMQAAFAELWRKEFQP